MIVECPGCTTIFPVDPKKIPAGGVNARCSKCSDVFFIAEPEKEVETVEPVATDTPMEGGATPPEGEVAEEPGGEAAEAAEAPQEVSPGEAADPLPEAEEVEPGGADSTAVEDDLEVEEAEGPMPTFGKRDPKEKAKRLARVLVSDIILYNPDRHHAATESGRVKEEFEEEIQKSWNEYVEQVGDEVANSTSFFNDALNEILAKGDKIF